METYISYTLMNETAMNVVLGHKQQVISKLKNNIMHNFYRIKPIKTSSKNKIYEMKLHLENKNYRIAFQMEKSKVDVFYISETLQKKKFDQEVRKKIQ